MVPVIGKNGDRGGGSSRSRPLHFSGAFAGQRRGIDEFDGPDGHVGDRDFDVGDAERLNAGDKGDRVAFVEKFAGGGDGGIGWSRNRAVVAVDAEDDPGLGGKVPFADDLEGDRGDASGRPGESDFVAKLLGARDERDKGIGEVVVDHLGASREGDGEQEECGQDGSEGARPGKEGGFGALATGGRRDGGNVRTEPAGMRRHKTVGTMRDPPGGGQR